MNRESLRETLGCIGLLVTAFGVEQYSRPAGIVCLGLFIVIYAIFGFDAGKNKDGN